MKVTDNKKLLETFNKYFGVEVDKNAR